MNDEVLTLNVGGKIYTTLKSTLTQKISCEESENFFTALFSNKYFVTKDSKGRLFIDRNGEHFKYILDYMRAQGNINHFALPQDEYSLKCLAIEAQFYNLKRLENICKRGGTEEEQINNKLYTTFGSSAIEWMSVNPLKIDLVTQSQCEYWNYWQLDFKVCLTLKGIKFGIKRKLNKHLHYFVECVTTEYNEHLLRGNPRRLDTTLSPLDVKSIALWFDVYHQELNVFVNGNLIDKVNEDLIPKYKDWHFYVYLPSNLNQNVFVNKDAIHPSLKKV